MLKGKINNLRSFISFNSENSKDIDPLADYFLGKKLYGDDFTYEELKEWYKDEEEGYSSLVGSLEDYSYPYHQLNIICGYSVVLRFKEQINSALLVGGFRGDEILPIIDKVKNVTILESSDRAYIDRLGHIQPTYIKSNISGRMSFPDESFDLITCFGVLHHIPNVSYVVKEMYRVASKEAFVLIREPIVSMGDWRKPRPNLTKRERGIPLNIFRGIIHKAGFKVVRETLIGFPVIDRIFKKINRSPYSSRIGVYSDIIASRLFSWNYTYHTENLLRKLRPTGVFFVLKKD